MPGDEPQSNPEPVPSHWKAPSANHPLFGRIPLLLFQALCLISVQRPSFDHHWKSKWDDKEWYKHMDKMVGQINNSNLASGLLLATTAVFLTTPPPLQSILNYTTKTSYAFALASFANALGSLLTGTAVIAIYQSCDRVWTRDVLLATRLRLYLIHLLMAWPSITLFLSIIFLMTSMLIAVLLPGFIWIQAAAGVELLLWVWAMPAFIFCTFPLPKRQSDEEVPMQLLLPERQGDEEVPVQSPLPERQSDKEVPVQSQNRDLEASVSKSRG